MENSAEQKRIKQWGKKWNRYEKKGVKWKPGATHDSV